MQLAGGAANVVFVAGANSQRKKSKLQQSDMGGIAHFAVSLLKQSAMVVSSIDGIID